MTPKEKAEELFNKMDMIIYTDQDNADEQAKKCALIAVDEILEECFACKEIYWREVKFQIEKL